jgi:hypothetical protein
MRTGTLAKGPNIGIINELSQSSPLPFRNDSNHF